MYKKLIYLTCLVLVLSVAGNASAQILVHYKLDETSGAVASDISGKGNDGTIDGGILDEYGGVNRRYQYDMVGRR